MTDPGLWFFLVLGFVAIQRRSTWLLTAASVLGVLNNEVFLMLTPMLLLVPGSWTDRLRLLLGILPGFLVFFVLRMLIEPPPDDMLTVAFFSSGEFWEAYAFQHVGSLHTYIALTLTFGPLWLPAIYAYLRAPLPLFLRRCLWFIPLVGVHLLGGGNIQRTLFWMFPVVIPLAVLGLTRWISTSPDPQADPLCPD